MARGYNAFGDVLKATIDGQDLNALWSEFAQTLTLQNDQRTALASLFTFNTVLPSELVPQALSGDDFEEASEYGIPTSLRPGAELVRVGYPARWYDKRTAYTWRYLSTATAAQVASVHAAALEADNRLVFRKVMDRALNPATTVNEDGTQVLGFWNGVDGTPPEHNGSSFDATHTHYTTSGAAALVSGDVDELVENVEHHGFGLRANGDRVIILANPTEADVIAGFRVANGDKFDFIPASDAPAFITAETIQGDRPPGTFNGLRVIGAYGDAWVVSDRGIPIGYVVALATGGPNSQRNPLGLREHQQANLRGLLQIPGNMTGYPLVDSFYTRHFGIGTRQRGAGAVMQVTANAAYTAPVI